jgi:histidinol-phosphate aminotransferase
MSGNFLALAQPGVQQLSPYVPGKPVDELARELDLDPARKSSNWRATKTRWAPVPKAFAAIREELAELTRYPDGNGFALKSPAGRSQCRVELNQVTLGNGSNDILELVARAYLAPG